MKQNLNTPLPSETETPVNNVLNFGNTLNELRNHVSPDLIRSREGHRDGNGNARMVEYVEWHTVADILDAHAPEWEHSIKDIRQIGEIATVTVAITINGVTREGIGTGAANTETGIKKAEHDALKRAAVKFGIARDLYKREFDGVRTDEIMAEADGRNNVPSDPVAKTLSDLVTAKQLGMIRAISREAGIDSEFECEKLLKCSVSELSKKAASLLIDHLQAIQKQGSVNVQPMRKAS